MKKSLFIFLFAILNMQFVFCHNISCPFDSIVCEIEDMAFSHGKEADKRIEYLCEQINNQRNKNNFDIWRIYCKSIVNYVQGMNDTSLMSNINLRLKTLPADSFLFEKALMQYSLALGYTSKGDYAEAFACALHALEQFQKQNNQKFTAKTLMILGSVCSFIKSYNMANDYYNQSIAFFTPEQIEYYLIRLNQYNLLAYTHKIDEAINSITKFIPDLIAYRDHGPLATAYVNLGGFYSATEKDDQAFEYFLLLEELLNTIDNKKITVTLYQNLGFYYVNRGNFKESEQYFKKSKEIAVQNSNLTQLFYATYGLSYMYEQLNVADSALLYLKQCYALRDQLANNSKTIEAYQTYVSMLLESSKKELKIAKQEITIKNRRFAITIILFIAIILLAVLLLIVLQQKKKIKEVEYRDLEDRLQHEKKIQQLQKEKIESQIREITSYSLMLSNKNHILQQISDATKQHSSANQNETEEQNQIINRIIKNNLNTDNDWNDFMLHFDKVHPKFFDKLHEMRKDLTENNLRMCAYFRIGMSTKQIAQILNILPDAVRKNRCRLKKKFSLQEEERLIDFLRNI